MPILEKSLWCRSAPTTLTLARHSALLPEGSVAVHRGLRFPTRSVAVSRQEMSTMPLASVAVAPMSLLVPSSTVMTSAGHVMIGSLVSAAQNGALRPVSVAMRSAQRA